MVAANAMPLAVRAQKAYRRDIDGLRGLAIALVVGYHLGDGFLPGGFVGVDVFFVISGFLITGLLLSELDSSGTIQLGRFWARRAARLLPALLLVTLFVLGSSTILLSRVGGETGPAARAAMATLLFNANHFFLLVESDYFGGAAASNPFLHAWSLSIEEQFYLLWPLCLVIWFRCFGTSGVVYLIAGLVGLSMVGSAAVQSSSAHLAFYGMPFRGFELLVGAALAVQRPAFSDTRAVGALTFAGLVTIASSAISLDAEVPFPWPWSLVPVAGAAMVIAGGSAGSSRWISRTLASSVMVYLGRVSYPLYLWHWPLLVLTRSYRMDEPAPASDWIVVGVSLLLAVLSYELFERRARAILNERWQPRRVLLIGAFATCTCVVSAALVGAWARFGWGYSPTDRALAAVRTDFPETGCMGQWPSDALLSRCYPPSATPSIFLWGDSHAKHWGPALKPAAERVGASLGIYTDSACKPLPMPQDQCLGTPAKVIELLPQWQQDRNLVGIVIAARWAYGIGTPSPTLSERGPKRAARFFDRSVHDSNQALRLVGDSAEHLFAETGARNVRVLLLLSSPVLRHKAPHCLSRRTEAECYVTRAEMSAYSGAVDSKLKDVASRWDHVRVLDPKDFLCDAERCPAVLHDTVVYSDMDHVTNSFARSQDVRFDPYLRWLLQAR